MSTTNTAKLHLVSRRNLANILKNGFSKQPKQDIPDSEKVYLNVREDKEDTGKPISPEKISVIVLKNKESKKLSTSPQKIEATIKLMREGIESSEYEIKAMPLSQYMDKMKAMQSREFQKQGNDEKDEEKTVFRVNEMVSRMANGLAKGVAVGVLARMNIRDKIKEKAEVAKQKNPRVQARDDKTKEALSKDDNGFNPYRENQDNGNREKAKNEQNSREIESRQQREKLEKEIAIKKIEDKINNGKELNKDEQDLYQAHLNETAKQKENVLGNSLMAYALQDNKDFQRRTNEVMKIAKEAANEKGSKQVEATKETLEQDEMEL